MDERATIVIFGASGDLTRRKLVPALFSPYVKGRLHSGTRIVGFAKDEVTDEAFRTHLHSGVEEFRGPLLNTAGWGRLRHQCPLPTRRLHQTGRLPA